MTSIMTIYTPRFIMMAADSLMVMGTRENPVGTKLIGKIFYSEDKDVAISAMGDGLKNNLFVGEIVNSFFRESLSFDVEMLAYEFERYMCENHKEFSTLFHICGFNGSVPYVYELDNIKDIPLRRVNLDQSGALKYSVLGEFLPETIDQIRSKLPNFATLPNEDARAFVNWTFDTEIENQTIRFQKSQRTIDVGEPIKILTLTAR